MVFDTCIDDEVVCWCIFLPAMVYVQVGGGPNTVDGVVGTVSGDVQTQELAAKIAENEQLHLKVSSGIYYDIIACNLRDCIY